jgi:uncharacterized phage infection (PIP) family protein YhgE
MTTHAKSKATPSPEAVSEALTGYLDYIATSHEKFAKSLKGASERAARVSDSLIGAVLEGQRAALDTSRKIAANPTDYATNIKTVMESATAAQERALGIAKTIYEAQADAASELRGLLEGAFATSTDLSEAARKFASFWPKAA